MQGLTHLRSTTWQEVLDAWRKREADHWGWEEHWKERGFDSWDAWREKIYKKYNAEDRKWDLYQVDDPLRTVPDFWAGGFKGWKKYYPEGVLKIRFKDLVKNPEVAENEKVKQILINFPKKATFICVRLGDEIALVEGMHRASALALAAQGQEIDTELTMALTELAEDEKGLFEEIITQKLK